MPGGEFQVFFDFFNSNSHYVPKTSSFLAVFWQFYIENFMF